MRRSIHQELVEHINTRLNEYYTYGEPDGDEAPGIPDVPGTRGARQTAPYDHTQRESAWRQEVPNLFQGQIVDVDYLPVMPGEQQEIRDVTVMFTGFGDRAFSVRVPTGDMRTGWGDYFTGLGDHIAGEMFFMTKREIMTARWQERLSVV